MKDALDGINLLDPRLSLFSRPALAQSCSLSRSLPLPLSPSSCFPAAVSRAAFLCHSRHPGVLPHLRTRATELISHEKDLRNREPKINVFSSKWFLQVFWSQQ